MNYRVIANRYKIESVFEDSGFSTTLAPEDSIVISGTKDKIITMLSALAIDVSELDKYE